MDFDESRLSTPNRFGKLSKNMFFARHVAQPKFLKFITGTAGVKVCHVNSDVPHLPANPSGEVAKSLLSDPRFTIEFPPNSYNEALLRSYSEKIQPRKRRERFLPPIRGWNASGTVVADTENWRRELARIAEMVGLVTTNDLAEIEHKKEPSVPSPPRSAATSTSRRSPLKSSKGEYSERTGRWNETPRPLTRSRSLNRRTPLSNVVPNHLFCVEEKEREIWMLQVLCQILKTENVGEIQAWLVASSSNEKEAVRQLITSAIKGLEESGRIQPTAYYDENAKGVQVNMDTYGSLVSNKFPDVLSNEVAPRSPPPLPVPVRENSTKSTTRSRVSSSSQSTVTSNKSNKSNRPFQANLEPITEEINSKPTVPQPTKVDIKRDIQVLTLSDDGNNNTQQPVGKDEQDEIPF